MNTLRALRRTALAGALAVVSLSTASAQFTTDQVAHILRRWTFGPATDQVGPLTNTNSLALFLTGQLGGVLNEDPAFLAAMATYGVPADTTANPNYGNWDVEQLGQQQLLRAAFSQNQLRELMTMFWHQSMSTSWRKVYAYLLANDATLLTNIGTGNISIPGATPAERATNATAYIMFLENESFRANALGTFEDLILSSAKSPAMLIYLDSVRNDVPPGSTNKANENYARELMELHTLGLSEFTGEPYWYSFLDIAELALIFSGWDVRAVIDPNHGQPTYEFVFNAAEHTDAPGYAFTNPAGASLTGAFGRLQITLGDAALGHFPVGNISGLAQGEEALKYLANSWETRLWVCGRLMEFFIGYRAMDPFDPLVQPGWPTVRPARKIPLPAGLTEADLDACMSACLHAWENSAKAGDIKAVLTQIFFSTAFNKVEARWTRAKNPLEFGASLLRAYDAELPTFDPTTGSGQLDEFMRVIENDLGMPLFEFPSPDGYTIKSEEILSTNGVVHRGNMAQEIVRDYVFLDPTASLGGSNPADVNMHPLGFLIPSLFENGTAADRVNNMVSYLANYPATGSNLDLGNTTEIVERVLQGLFGGDFHPTTQALALSFFTTYEGVLPDTIQNLVLGSQPGDPNQVINFLELGRGITGFMAYAAALPQFQLK